MRVDQKVKILEISSYPPPRAGWGVRITFVRKYLEDAGHECRVLNIGESRKVKSADYLDVQSGSDYFKKVWRHVREGYLIHTHLNGDSEKGLVLAIVAEILALGFGRRSVLTFHAGPIQRMFPKEKSRLMAPFFALAFVLPKKIICNNDAVKEKLCTYGVPEEKILAIPAFSKQYLDYAPRALPQALDDFITAQRPLIASYFFLRPEFFVDSMLKAIKQLTTSLPDLGLVLIGGDTQGETVRRLVETAGLTNQVYFAGDLDHDTFMTVMAKADFYLRTPQKDGVCSSVLEALTLRTPVVASRNGSRPESVINYECDRADDLAEKLQAAWADYDQVVVDVVVPKVDDTVREEAALLVDLAR